VVEAGVEGDLIEAGAWRGGASILMRATLDSLGADDRTVCVADSFQGFPMPEESDVDQEKLNVVDFLAVPQEEVRANFARFGLEHGVSFVPGFVEDTLPGLSGRRWSIVRLDVDTYEATRFALESLYPHLSTGGYLIVDDYGTLEECRRAVDEFRSEQGIGEPLEKVGWACVRWRRERDIPLKGTALAPSRSRSGVAGPRRAVARPPRALVPTIHELELTREVATLRGRLEVAEAEVGLLRGSPLRRARAWARRKRPQRGV